MAEKPIPCGFRVTVNGQPYVQTCPTYEQWKVMCKRSPLTRWRYEKFPFVVSKQQDNGAIVYLMPTKQDEVVLLGAVKEDGALYMREDMDVSIYYCPCLVPLDKDDRIDTTLFKNGAVRYGGSYTLNGVEYGRSCCTDTLELHAGDLLVHNYPQNIRLPGKGELKWVSVNGVLICKDVLCFTSLEQLFVNGLLPFNESSLYKA